MLIKKKCIVLKLVVQLCLDTEFIEEGKKKVALFIVTSSNVSLLFFVTLRHNKAEEAPQNSMFVEQ